MALGVGVGVGVGVGLGLCLGRHGSVEVALLLGGVGLDATDEVGLRLAKRLHQLGELPLELAAQRRARQGRAARARLGLGEDGLADGGGARVHQRAEVGRDLVAVLLDEALRLVAHLARARVRVVAHLVRVRVRVVAHLVRAAAAAAAWKGAVRLAQGRRKGGARAVQGWGKGGARVCGALGRAAHVARVVQHSLYLPTSPYISPHLARVVLYSEAGHEARSLLAALGREDAYELGVLVLLVHGAHEALVAPLGDDHLVRGGGGGGGSGEGLRLGTGSGSGLG